MNDEDKAVRDAIFSKKDKAASLVAKQKVKAEFDAAPDKAAQDAVADRYGVKAATVKGWKFGAGALEAGQAPSADVEKIKPTSPRGEVLAARYKSYADMVQGFRAGTWLRVRIAGMVETKFGEAKLAEFAADTDTAVHTIENYRSVDRAYPLDDYGLTPAFTVGVAKVFMRVDKDERAGLVTGQEWTVETATAKVKQLKAAGAKPTPEDLDAVLKAAEAGSSLSSIAQLSNVHRDVTKAALGELVEAGKVETWEQENGHKRYCLPGKAPEQPPDGPESKSEPHSGYFAGGESGEEHNPESLASGIEFAATCRQGVELHAAIENIALHEDLAPTDENRRVWDEFAAAFAAARDVVEPRLKA